LKLSELIASSFNCLILDEPTNHLDLPAREQLEEALEAFGGTLLVVSHDRYFNERVVDRFWILTPGGIEVWEDSIETYLMPEPKREEVKSEPKPSIESKATGTRRVNPWRVAEIEQEIEAIEIELFDLSEALEEVGSDHKELMRLNERIGVSTQKRDALIEEWMRAQGEGEDPS
jgi:ATP-binding cassette subfamily F protein 3